MEFNRTRFDPGLPDEHGHVTRSFAKADAVADADAGASTYTYTDTLILAINVALAVGRPLLLTGEPGCGKTTLARNIALVKRWSFYHQNIGSRTQAADLLWEFDSLRRLNDANVRDRNVLPDSYYVDPGKLWWALAPESAARRGDPGYSAAQDKQPPLDPAELLARDGTVVLIDEIDKAEPDVPNDLLEVLDTQSFSVKGSRVNAERRREDVLVVITTNGERELPGAFLRRCVVHRLSGSEPGWFAGLAQQRYPAVAATLIAEVEAAFVDARNKAELANQRRPGTAEFLDAIAALQHLGLQSVQGDAWKVIERCMFGKQALLDSQ